MQSWFGSSSSSSDNKKKLKEVFEQYGKKSGDEIRLEKKELKAAFEHLGALMPGYKAASALKYIDTDKSGYIKGTELDALVEYAYSSGHYRSNSLF
ncbi:hypothetical protein E1A91_A08G164800v1 [Gossypium mustelinum]|uniref:EF-hand domain-containing protein n=1 Tax=Gossypium mustelinum TaxID=34275 RepID=A0A5D2YB60_GOSMU|nr:hypothetical protein E1A91_A08G164800v1 [Gossypium mustelinum]